MRRDRHLDEVLALSHSPIEPFMSSRRSLRIACSIAGLSALCACRPSREPPRAVDWLRERADQEAQLARSSRADHDFHFTDQRDSSGITFRNQIVDDAGKTYKKA